MFGNIQELPNITGCSIGGIISKSKIELLNLEKHRTDLEIELQKYNKDYSEEELKSKQKTLEKEKPKIQNNLLRLGGYVLRLQTELETIDKQIQSLLKAQDYFFQEVLPIDWSQSKIIAMPSRVKPRENYIKLDISSKSGMDEKLEKFFYDLFNNNARTNYLESDVFSRFYRTIDEAIQKECRVSIVGSFITLSKVEAIAPIILRKSPPISKKLLDHADDYHVFTQQILGGVFIGIEAEKKSDLNEMATRMNFVSYISQGAIPDPCQPQTMINLYNSWKQKLLKPDEFGSGYPVAYGSMKLTDLLEEQDLLKKPKE